MANTQGAAWDDPVCIADHDDDELMYMGEKTTAYIALDDDGKETELSVEAIPDSAQNKRRSKSNRYSAHSTPGNTSFGNSFTIRKEDSAGRNTTRTPSAKLGPREPIVLSSDEDTPAPPSWRGPRNRARTVVTLPGERHRTTHNTRLPERTKPSETSTASIPPQQGRTSSGTKDYPVLSATTPEITSRERTPATGTVQAGSTAQITTPSTTTGVTSDASACNLPLVGQPDVTTRSQQGTAQESHSPTDHHENGFPRSRTLDPGLPNNTIQMSADSPIGDSADFQRGREQTTSRHVARNATLTPERVNSTKATDKHGPPVLSDHARKSSGSGTHKPPPKARMVKRAVSPPRQTFSKEQSHGAAASHAPKAKFSQRASRGSYGLEVSKEQEGSALPTSTHQAENLPKNAYHLSSELLPRHNNSQATSVAATNMGAQLSAPAVVLSPILPSIERTGAQSEISKKSTPRARSTSLPMDLIEKVDGIDTSLGTAPSGFPENTDEEGRPTARAEYS